jgi:hypothetical protein
METLNATTARSVGVWRRWIARVTVSAFGAMGVLLVLGVVFPTPDVPCNDVFFGDVTVSASCAGGGPRFSGLTLVGLGNAESALVTAAMFLAMAVAVALAASELGTKATRWLPVRFVVRLGAVGLLLAAAGVVEGVFVFSLVGVALLGAAATLVLSSSGSRSIAASA